MGKKQLTRQGGDEARDVVPRQLRRMFKGAGLKELTLWLQETGAGGVHEGAAGVRVRRHLPDLGMRVGALKNLAISLLAGLETLQDDEEAAAGGALDFYAEVRNFEIQMITAALQQAGGKQCAAARLLKLNPTTLNSKIKMYNLKPDPERADLYRLQSAAAEGGLEKAENSADA